MQKIYYRDWAASRFVPFAFLVSRLAAPLSRGLAALGVKPNYVTFCVAVSGAVAGVAAFQGAWIYAAAGLMAFLVLDHVDGQIARATNQRTALGGYLDTLVDLVFDVLFLAALVAWGILHDDRIALLALMALAGYVLLELVTRHGSRTRVLEALRRQDFRPADKPPRIWGPVPIVPHRDLNIVVLSAALVLGELAVGLAALTVWWSAWGMHRVAKDMEGKDTKGLLANLMHEDNH